MDTVVILQVVAVVRRYQSSGNTLSSSKHQVSRKTAPYIPALKRVSQKLMLSIKIGVLSVKRRSFMTLFTRTLESSAHTKRQFVKAQHLPVLAGSLSLCDYLRQMGERSA
ncbi:transposase, partial [Photorhabdus temperata subsp. temperata M1021]